MYYLNTVKTAKQVYMIKKISTNIIIKQNYKIQNNGRFRIFGTVNMLINDNLIKFLIQSLNLN